jgi:Zn-dependent alcohol dehydrogenase
LPRHLSAGLTGWQIGQAARFDLSRLVTRYPLDDLNRALTEMASGSVMKVVLVPEADD